MEQDPRDRMPPREAQKTVRLSMGSDPSQAPHPERPARPATRMLPNVPAQQVVQREREKQQRGAATMPRIQAAQGADVAPERKGSLVLPVLIGAVLLVAIIVLSIAIVVAWNDPGKTVSPQAPKASAAPLPSGN